MASKKNKKQDANKKPNQQVKIVKKSQGKSQSSQKNSAITAVSTNPKPRVYKSLPKGYRVTKNAKVVNGKVKIHNGKPLFTTNRNGQKQIATDRNGKPAHKKALLVVDPKAQQKTSNTKKPATQHQAAPICAEEVVTIIIKTHNDAKGGHPHIIIDDVDDKHVSVGLTSDAYKGKGHKNICLKINPLGGSDPSYMKRQGTVSEVARYGSPRNGSLAKSDHEKAKQIGDKAKQKYLKNKKKP